MAVAGEWVDGEGSGDGEEFFGTHWRAYYAPRMRVRHGAWKDVRHGHEHATVRHTGVDESVAFKQSSSISSSRPVTMTATCTITPAFVIGYQCR